MLKFLQSLNTHSIAIGGVLLVALGLLTDAGFAKAIIDLLPAGAQAYAGKVEVALGALAAYLGRPKTV